MIRAVRLSLDTDVPTRLRTMAGAVRRTPASCVEPWTRLTLYAVAARLQAQRYVEPTPEVEEIPVDACEVLSGGGGDCKAKSIAFAAVAAAKCLAWRFHYYYLPGAPLGHVRVDVWQPDAPSRRQWSASWVAYEPTLSGMATLRRCMACLTEPGEVYIPAQCATSAPPSK